VEIIFARTLEQASGQGRIRGAENRIAGAAFLKGKGSARLSNLFFLGWEMDEPVKLR
jgi:hypothetical protein